MIGQKQFLLIMAFWGENAFQNLQTCQILRCIINKFIKLTILLQWEERNSEGEINVQYEDFIGIVPSFPQPGTFPIMTKMGK